MGGGRARSARLARRLNIPRYVIIRAQNFIIATRNKVHDIKRATYVCVCVSTRRRALCCVTHFSYIIRIFEVPWRMLVFFSTE